MTPATLALVERLAKDCIAEDWTDHDPGYYRDMNLERFWQAAMEHAAGIAEKTMPRYNWASENADIYHAQNHMLSRAAAAIREAGK